MNHRVHSWDNLRLALVLCVVLQHSSNAYNNLTWWAVSDGNSSLIVEWLAAFLDVFTMPHLFFYCRVFCRSDHSEKGTLGLCQKQI